MKKNKFNIILLSTLTLCAASCIESSESVDPETTIAFDVETACAVEGIETKAADIQRPSQEVLVSQDNKILVASCQTSDMENLEQEIETRATRYNSETEFADASQTFKLWGWKNSTQIYSNETVSKTGGKWKPATAKTWNYCQAYTFEALYPGTAGLANFTPATEPGSVTFQYAHQTGQAAPSDYMLAYYSRLANTGTNNTAKLVFTHPFTCVKFAAGNGITVNSVTLQGLYSSGVCSVIKNNADANHPSAYYTYSWNPGAKTHEITCAVSNELLLIPQAPATDNIILTANVTVDGVTFDAATTLTTGSWQAGKVYTYTFNKSDKDIDISVTDKVNGNVKDRLVIRNIGTATGYIRAAIVAGWYNDSNVMVAPWDPNSGSFVGFPGNNWKQVGDFYYYQNPVDGGDETGDKLFTSYTHGEAPVYGAHLKMVILAQGVIWDADKARVSLAWGAQTVTNANLN